MKLHTAARYSLSMAALFAGLVTAIVMTVAASQSTARPDCCEPCSDCRPCKCVPGVIEPNCNCRSCECVICGNACR